MPDSSTDVVEQPFGLRPLAVTIPKARSLLGDKARSEIYRCVSRGELDAVKDGRRTLIVVASIEKFMAALPRAKFTPLQPALDGQRRGRKPRTNRKRA